MSLKAKLVFFGNERLATGLTTDAPVLRGLVETGYDITCVVASHSESVSRSKRGLEIVEVAHAYHIPILLPGKVEEVAEQLAKTGAEAGILIAFGQIVPQSIIDIFPRGIINIHPSLLPKYRGPTPIESVILDGVAETGVSLMALAAKMDAGPVYLHETVTLDGDETKPALARKLLHTGQNLLIDNLDDILAGTIEAIPQDADAATYSKLINKTDGLVDFNKSAEQIEREIRAYAGWPKSRAKVFGQDIVITKAAVTKGPGDGDLVIKCQPGYIEIIELTGPSGRSMRGADFIRGYKK